MRYFTEYIKNSAAKIADDSVESQMLDNKILKNLRILIKESYCQAEIVKKT